MTEDMLAEILIFLGLMATLATIAKISLALIRRRAIDAQPSSLSIEHLADQIDQLRLSVDATAIEIERLGEGQRFMAKALTERVSPSDSSRPNGRVVTPH